MLNALYLEKGILRYEMDMYNFIKSLLLKKHESYQDTPKTSEEIDAIIEEERMAADPAYAKAKQAKEAAQRMELQRADIKRKEDLKRQLKALEIEQEQDKLRVGRMQEVAERDEARKLGLAREIEEEKLRKEQQRLERELAEQVRKDELGQKRQAQMEENLRYEQARQREVQAKREADKLRYGAFE